MALMRPRRIVGASLLAKIVNDNAASLNPNARSGVSRARSYKVFSQNGVVPIL
ncbi:hypothetical protein PS858_01021 [Pseudomonas fluorescens]|uniref:Uncharacterized protein n=1 Tax=Pseudomonas fluorescens TaxID=294 RepID=A0A5E6WFQ9_PSEFL|nr:hypothetical protein PS676_04634 [Pseudomonas fluorescens]VVO14660.1 hypothetical protein PS704_03729 [Pseudomonas fluorescens]VVO65642.1 hypothetical protein PS858_01021 [Pseudomonas fluorescens]